jgi:RHS repeat-associated protein
MNKDCGTAAGSTTRYVLTRLTFTAPDGTEYELRDQATGGKPFNVHAETCAGGAINTARGPVFVSADGSAMTFVSDSAIQEGIGTGVYYPTGHLLLRDGSRFRIEEGVVKWIRDRNGNRLDFTYDEFKQVTEIVDSMKRKITISYWDPLQNIWFDEITYKGFGGAVRKIKVHYTNLVNVLRSGTAQGSSGYTIKTMSQLFPTLNGADPNVDNDPWVISSVELPDQRHYRFYYNSYAEIARVELPTGGAYEYDFPTVSGVIVVQTPHPDGFFTVEQHVVRRLLERRVYPDGQTLERRTVYTATEVSGDTVVEVMHKNFGGQIEGRTKHYFESTPNASFIRQAIAYPAWMDGKEVKSESYNAIGGLLRQVEHLFAQRAAVPWWNTWPEPGGGLLEEEPPNDVRLLETITTLKDASPNLVTKQTFAYDTYNNRTDTWDYDFGQSNPPAFATRRTHTDYLTTITVNSVNYNYATDNNIHLRSLPRQQFIYNVNPANGAQTEISKTEFEYDKYDTGAGHAALTARSNICGHEASFNDTYRTRGNVTETRRWLNTSSVWLKINNQYDIAGNVVKVVDARGKETQFDFQDRFGVPDAEARGNDQVISELAGGLKTFAFPTSETNPLQHKTYTQYDYYIGRAVDAEDENGVISSGEYEDALDRPTQLVGAVSMLALRHQTTFAYDDAARIVTTSTDQKSFGDNLNKTEVVYDGLGRQIEARDYETATAYIKKTQNYDAMGRVRQVSNPHRQGDTVLNTTTTYDTLGRVVLVALPDTTTVSTAYEGNKTTVTDQAGRKRSVIKDGLGRTTKAFEDPAVLNYETVYTYDGHDKLLTVKQGPTSQQQMRTYVYDSLGRLTQATIPEHVGSTSYQYDSNSNIATITDPRPGKSITFTYDDLNRPLVKNYSDTTPDVTFNYDSAAVTNSKGKLTSVVTSGSFVSSYSYDEYDALGRIKRTTQTTDSNTYQMSYSYDLGGNMTSMTYPSGRIINSTYDAADRISAVSGIRPGTPGEPAKTYVAMTSYTAHEVLKTMMLGNGLWEHTDSNQRLQLKEIGLGTSETDSSKVKLEFDYGTTANNGNMLSQKITVGASIINQSYGYDQLNRLTQVQESVNTVNRWTQNYGYDRFGNRTSLSNSGSEGGLLPAQTTPPVNSLTNRLLSITYDQAGNPLSDGPPSNSYSYDADNRLTICTVAGVTSSYCYDGLGRRVKKQVGSTTTIFVYDLAGKLIAEYDSTPQVSQGVEATSYLTPDHLGSIRVVTDRTANVKNRFDYQPFGEVLAAGIGSRGTSSGYSQAYGVRNRFTSKERDEETGLDYFGARYYLGPHARFMGVDPKMESAQMSQPQSWNRYSYVLNNPLTMIDPDGMGWVEIGGSIGWDKDVDSQDEADKKYGKGKARYLQEGTIRIITSARRGSPWAGFVGRMVVLTSGGVMYDLGPERAVSPEEINFWAGRGQQFLAAYLKFAAENVITGLAIGKAFQAIENLYDMAKAAKASKQSLEAIKGYCFVAGTIVVTSKGDKPIEELKEGDLVLASDPECGEVGYKRVLQTIERIAPEVLDIEVAGTIITCTPEHPFWVEGRGWVEADDLTVGGQLLTRGEEMVCVESVGRRAGRFKVYNIEVEDHHTYFVSKIGVLVHNSKCAISAIADDWAVKGAHIHVNGIELAVRPGMNGEIVFKSVFSRVNPAKLTAAIKTAQEALMHDSHFQQALLRSSRQAVEYLGKGASELARSRSGEIHFLVKALEKMGIK